MFTGIVSHRGSVKDRLESATEVRFGFTVEPGFMDQVGMGDSISVSGVCLTVVEHGSDYFCADVSRETLLRTTLGSCVPGNGVNLELSLRASDRLGGHLVSGHIDSCIKLVSKQPSGGSQRMVFEYPQALAKYVAVKGSVCIDGVSLTVNEIGSGESDQDWFCVNVIPHTLEVTTLGDLDSGDTANLEVDMIARYLERMMKGGGEAPEHAQ